jgi:hypothetical protein
VEGGKDAKWSSRLGTYNAGRDEIRGTHCHERATDGGQSFGHSPIALAPVWAEVGGCADHGRAQLGGQGAHHAAGVAPPQDKLSAELAVDLPERLGQKTPAIWANGGEHPGVDHEQGHYSAATGCGNGQRRRVAEA